MSFNFRELEYFVAIADHRHFGKASQAVNVSQPTLSMQFKKLEDRLGGRLIERLPRDAILTPLGAEVLPLAREILRLAAEIESRAKGNKIAGRIRLGVLPTISPYLLPKINRSLSKATHGRKLSLTEGQTGELVNKVKSGSIDAAILSLPLGERGLVEVPVFSEPFYLAVHRAHRLAGRRRVSISDIKGEKLLLLGEGHCLRNQALTICNSKVPSEGTDLTATSIETLRSMVAMSEGVTLIPKLAIRRGENVAYVPFTEASTSRVIGVVYRPSLFETDSIANVVEIIREAARKDDMVLL